MLQQESETEFESKDWTVRRERQLVQVTLLS